MNYIEYKFEVDEPTGEIIVAYLADMPFESFYYDGGVQCCYITKEQRDRCLVEIEACLASLPYICSFAEIETMNWNAEWEADFEPIVVGDKVEVHSPSHPSNSSEIEIIINPNMSFGTGHHPTTYMMLEGMASEDFSQRTVLDVGCGSAVLSIMGALCGASGVVGVDIDSWAAESARGNLVLNGVQGVVTVLDGTVAVVEGESYDFVLANIARNVLQGDMEAYYRATNRCGKLLCSGFLEVDAEAVIESAQGVGYKLSNCSGRENWTMLTFIKE